MRAVVRKIFDRIVEPVLAELPVWLLVAFLALAVMPLHAAPPAHAAAAASSGYIVVFKQGTDTDRASDQIAGRLGLKVGARYRHALRGMAVELPSAVPSTLR